MTKEEAKNYKCRIKFKLFWPNAIQTVINGSESIPQIIDKILDMPIILGDKLNLMIFFQDLVKKVTKSI